MARSLQWGYYYHSLWGQLSTTGSNATEVAKWAASISVDVDNNQLQIIASETVDSVDSPSPQNFQGNAL